MKTRLLIIVGIIFTLSSIMSIPNQANALLCDNSNMKILYDQKDAVFEGKAIHKEYIPLSDATLVTFEIQTIFKGDLPNPITVSTEEGFYGPKIHEGRTHLIFADKTSAGYDIPLCTPTFYSFPSLVKVIQSIKDGDESVDSITWGDMYENYLSKQEKKELEEITSQGNEAYREEYRKRMLLRDIAIVVSIAGAIVAIPIGIVLQKRKNRRKRK